MTIPALVERRKALREEDIRELIARRVQGSSSWQPSARIIAELALCQAEARVDLAVVNGELTGWEIKTATDNLARLPRQQETYGRVFDRMWLAADAKHIDRALKQLPEWWGVLRVTGTPANPRTKIIRSSRVNRSIELQSLVCLLWRDEALEELRMLGLDDGMHRRPRTELWSALAAACPRHITKSALRARVRDRIRSRTGWRVA